MFNFFFKQMSKAFAKGVVHEMNKSDKQRAVKKLQKETKIPLDPDFYEIVTDKEYQNHLDDVRERLYEIGQEIVDEVWDVQDLYMEKEISLRKMEGALEKAYQRFENEIANSNFAPREITMQERRTIIQRYKKNIDYIKFTWLPKNQS